MPQNYCTDLTLYLFTISLAVFAELQHFDCSQNTERRWGDNL